MSVELSAGLGRNRTRLWDASWRLIWDSATAKTAAYEHINTWVNATIDQPDGSRWGGQFYRCIEGIRRWSLEPEIDLTALKTWPNPAISVDGEQVYP